MVSFGYITKFLEDYLNPQVQLGSVKSDEFLRYFPGGWRGVRTRVGDYIRREIKGLTREERRDKALLIGINPLMFEEIIRRNYRNVDGELINNLPLAYIFDIDSKEMFGIPDIPDVDRERIVQRIREENAFCGGTKMELGQLTHAGSNEVPLERVVDVYVTFLAIQEL